jgi:tRNA pseudouridine55 synthase
VLHKKKVLLIGKPFGWSSADVVRLLKRKLKPRKIGHAGTLDPRATGLLIILLDEATKRFAEFQKLPKVYEAEIEFGLETDTYDSEGQIVAEYSGDFLLDKNNLEKELKEVVGKQPQTPPLFSAVKIKGQRAYDLARAGKDFVLEPKMIEVYEACLLESTARSAKVRFAVSSGTYIRSLAHDLGRKMGVGAYLKNLRRITIGDYQVADAKKVEDFE